MTALAPTLQAFFTDRLALQRQASGHTVAAYRDALRMLIVYAAQHAGKAPSRLDIADLDAQTVGAFLNHLENERGNSVRTRNARLAAIHSLFGYAAMRHPEHAADIQGVLAIPPKRFDKALITYLAEDEITALLAAPDLATWTGRRDQALLVLACQTGLRATELTSLAIGDAHPGHRDGAALLARRARRAPRRPAVHHPPRHPAQPRRPGTADRQVHRDRCADVPVAAGEEHIAPYPSALGCHEAARRRRRYLGHRAVDGHENTATTQVYIHADLALKERAIARTAPQDTTPGRYQPADDILAFLDGL